LSGIRGKLPILGICYGAQLLAASSGGQVMLSKSREYGRATLEVMDVSSSLFKDFPIQSQVWMSHGDTITALPRNFLITASTTDIQVGAFQVTNEQTYGIQFHPEVYHTTEGITLLRNFVVDICGCSQTWTPASFIEETTRNLRETLGSDKVVLGLSGGVDSSVAALLLHRAIGKNLTCIFVDNGLLRKNEYQQVLDSFGSMGLNIVGVDASQQFYNELKGVTDPESKRKIIGRNFIEVFEREAQKIQGVSWLAQELSTPM
jgi:GMP synthase (glutamine-hydrolyzing) (EC 6.3.5.2)